MPVFASQHLPGTGGEFRATPDDLSCEEILVRQAGGSGGFWWIKAVKHGIGTSQARAAVARTVGCDPERVGIAGQRDRRARCSQWFSVPEDLVETPGALRNAGFRSSLKVVDVQQAKGPIGPDSVVDLRWSLRLRDAAAGDGYQRALRILSHLRQTGLPNYLHHGSRKGSDQDLARWGRLLIGGGRLPAAVARSGVAPGACLAALQNALFNGWLEARVVDGLLPTCLDGDRVRTGLGDEVVVDDPAAWQKRMDSWEVVPLGPLFGGGMTRVAGQAAAREAAILAAHEVEAEGLGRLDGGRRAMRVQPRKTLLDLDGKDLLLACELPATTWIDVLVDEIIKPVREPT